MAEPFVFNPIDPAVRRAPYALYERGRREHPAFVHAGLPIPLVSIFRYADVQAVLRDPEVFSNDFMRGRSLPPEIVALGRQAPPSMLGTDPPVHTRLRSLMNKAFTPRIVRKLEPRLREVAHELLDAALAQREVDLVQALTYGRLDFGQDLVCGGQAQFLLMLVGLDEEGFDINKETSGNEKGSYSNNWWGRIYWV